MQSTEMVYCRHCSQRVDMEKGALTVDSDGNRRIYCGELCLMASDPRIEYEVTRDG